MASVLVLCTRPVSSASALLHGLQKEACNWEDPPFLAHRTWAAVRRFILEAALDEESCSHVRVFSRRLRGLERVAACSPVVTQSRRRGGFHQCTSALWTVFCEPAYDPPTSAGVNAVR